MTELRAQFEALGFAKVATFIASGNVIFESNVTDTTLLQTQIENNLQQALGYRVPTFIRSSKELAAIASYQPFPPEPHFSTYSLSVMMMAERMSDDIQHKFLTFRTLVDEFHIHDREIYWLCRKKITESLVDWKLLGKTMIMPTVTMRNITTIRKLAARYGDRND
jgi:uncharacterized protein (DUF1697 family)